MDWIASLHLPTSSSSDDNNNKNTSTTVWYSITREDIHKLPFGKSFLSLHGDSVSKALIRVYHKHSWDVTRLLDNQQQRRNNNSNSISNPLLHDINTEKRATIAINNTSHYAHPSLQYYLTDEGRRDIDRQRRVFDEIEGQLLKGNTNDRRERWYSVGLADLERMSEEAAIIVIYCYFGSLPETLQTIYPGN